MVIVHQEDASTVESTTPWTGDSDLDRSRQSKLNTSMYALIHFLDYGWEETKCFMRLLP